MAIETKYLGSVICDWVMELDSDQWVTKILPLLQKKQVQRPIIESQQLSLDNDEDISVNRQNSEAV